MASSLPRRYAGLSGDQRTARRRESLLEAGLDVFAAAGISGATMTAICARAKLTERYFYESFTSRDELLQTVLDGIAEEVRRRGLDALHADTGTLEQRVRNAIASFVTILTEDPRKGRFALIESAAVEPLRTHRRAALRVLPRWSPTRLHACTATAPGRRCRARSQDCCSSAVWSNWSPHG